MKPCKLLRVLGSGFGFLLLSILFWERALHFAGLPVLHMPRIVCSSTAERKDIAEKSLDQGTTCKAGFSQLVAAMSTASALTAAHPALALVDERLSTEGTGLGLGLSNSKLTWILVGVTTLIWVLYFIYSTGLPEGDDDSGLSLWALHWKASKLQKKLEY